MKRLVAAMLIVVLIPCGWLLYKNPISYYVSQIRSIDSSPSEKWRIDLRYLADELPSIHPNLFHGMTREEYKKAVKHLDQRIPELNTNQIIIELMRLVSMVSSKGRDGHTTFWSLQAATNFHILPIHLYLFDDGLFVVNAAGEYQDLVSTRVTKIGDMEIEKVLNHLDPLVARDSDMWAKRSIPLLCLIPEVLHSLAIISETESVLFFVEDSTGRQFTRNIAPMGVDDYFRWRSAKRSIMNLPQTKKGPLYLQNQEENFWLRHLKTSKTLYVQYNAVQAQTQSGESLSEFGKRIAEIVTSKKVDKVVIDLRHNVGGDNTTYGPFLDIISNDKNLNQKGKLFAIIGRSTLSAAGNFVTELERKTKTIFVGEPTGGSPNQYGDSEVVKLPNSGLEIYVATRYWQKSDADDSRLSHDPHIQVVLSSSDFFGGHDPVMKAILSYQID